MAGCVKLTPNGCFWQQGVLGAFEMHIAEPTLNFRLWQCCVLTGEVQKAKMDSGNLLAYWWGQIKLTSVGCQCIHGDAFGVHQVTQQPDLGTGMELCHGWVDSGGEAESREFLHTALSLHCLSCLWLLLVQVHFLSLPWNSPLQWSVTSHLKAVFRAVYCTLGAIIFVFMRMHPAFCIFKFHE